MVVGDAKCSHRRRVEETDVQSGLNYIEEGLKEMEKKKDTPARIEAVIIYAMT